MPGVLTWAAKVEEAWDARRNRRRWQRGFEHPTLVPYLGYANDTRLVLAGRVLDDRRPDAPDLGEGLWSNLRASWRRFETDEIAGARVRLTLAGHEVEEETDAEGLFRFELDLDDPLDPRRLWHPVTLTLVQPETRPVEPVQGRVLRPRRDAGFVVVSDLDDTVVRTGATNKLRMATVVALNNARSRSPFEGVGDLYRALQAGADGGPANPVLYVSSSPWNLYGMFQAFLHAHHIPTGPIFLKDFGLSRTHVLSGGHHEHKLDQIERLMATWPSLPFVLVGDSGQADPEIYQTLVGRHPGRVRAVLIRDVSRSRRDAVVRGIAEDVAAAGVPMRLVRDTLEAAEAARDLGLVTDAALSSVRSSAARAAGS